ncbi:hypothetical protein SAMN05444368_1833 [Acetomicrobium flavidum]|uniref:ParE toxin of type II toxin-antitoxin system, parDE n=1 Tax=Acetomicrobium flavidum TaxID=49896 RepID=A0ABY1JF69_9BACT|nr:hypothetical protein SAMN05444368_1833 [Acetomicrobium flavidum]
MNFELHLTKSAEKDLTKLRGLAEEAIRVYVFVVTLYLQRWR